MPKALSGGTVASPQTTIGVVEYAPIHPADSPTDRVMIVDVSAAVSHQPETVGSEPATDSPRGLRVVVHTATTHCKQILMIGLFFHKSANFSYYYIFGLEIYLISQIIGLLLQRITNIHSAIYED
mgnify:CR=1 FL=1